MPDPSRLSHAITSMLQDFSTIPGLKINTTKSMLYPILLLTNLAKNIKDNFSFQWVKSLLEISCHKNPSESTRPI